MALYIAGHSNDTSNQTFVPYGAVVTFYTPEGQALSFKKTLAILRGKYKGPTRTVGSSTEKGLHYVKNYSFSNYSTNELDIILNAQIADARASMVVAGVDFPGGTSLCEGGCDESSGRHTCKGIFGRWSESWSGSLEYRILACLGEADDSNIPKDSGISEEGIKNFLKQDWPTQKLWWERRTDAERSRLLLVEEMKEFLACLWVDSYSESRPGSRLASYRAYRANLQEKAERGPTPNTYSYDIYLHMGNFQNVKQRIREGKEIMDWISQLPVLDQSGDRYAYAKGYWDSLNGEEREDAFALSPMLPDWLSRVTGQVMGGVDLGPLGTWPMATFDTQSIRMIKTTMGEQSVEWSIWEGGIQCIQWGTCMLVEENGSWDKVAEALRAKGASTVELEVTLAGEADAEILRVKIKYLGDSPSDFQTALNRWNSAGMNFFAELDED